MNIRVADWVKAILVTGSIVLIFIIAGRIYNTIQIFIGALTIAYLITPIIAFLEEKKAHRYIAIALAYIMLLAIAALSLAVIIPLVAQQVRGFIEGLPVYARTLQEQFQALGALLDRTDLGAYIDLDPQVVVSELTSIITDQLGNIITLIPSILGFIVEGFLVLFISLYIIIAVPMIHKNIKSTLREDEARDVYDDFNVTMRQSLNSYLKGLVLVMITVGTLSGIGYWIIGLPYPLLLGIWAGITEVIPYLGPTLGFIPALIIAITLSPTKALLAFLVLMVIQSLESGVISPAIISGTNKLPPLVVTLSLLAGAEIGGIIGLLLAVPIAVFVSTIVSFARNNFSYVRSKTGPDHVTLRKERS